jgi:hypothetical protein
MLSNKNIDPELKRKLSLLNDTPERSAENAAKGRSAFLKEASLYRQNSSGLIGQRKLNQKPKAETPRSVPARWRPQILRVGLPILLAIVVVFATGWITVRASQVSQPNQLLYSVKLASEEVAISMAANPAEQFDLSSAYFQNRASEIILIFNKGEAPSEQAIQRFGAQVDESIEIAAGMEDAQAIEALGRVESRLETQIQAVKLLKVETSSDASIARDKVLGILLDKLDLVKKGKANLAWLRAKLAEKSQSGQGTGATPTPTPGSNSNDQPAATSVNGNSQATHTHTPGAGNGQGNGNNGNSNAPTKTPPGNSQGGKKTATSTPAATDEGTSATATPKNKNK